MRRTLTRLATVTSLALGSAVLVAGPAAAEPAGPPTFVVQDRSIFTCAPDLPETSRRNVGGRCQVTT